MKNIWILALTLISSCSMAFGQTVDRTTDKNYTGSATIGTNSTTYTATNSAAWLAIGKDSTSKGMILPRVVDTSDIDNPVKGLFVFQNEDSTIYYYTDKWNDLGSSVNLSDYYKKDSVKIVVSDSLAKAVLLKDSTVKYVTPTQLDDTATAIRNDFPDTTSISNRINNKVDKVSGKGLSTNDYTDAEKTKLSGIATGAEVNVQSDLAQTDNTADDYVKNKNNNYLTNGRGYYTAYLTRMLLTDSLETIRQDITDTSLSIRTDFNNIDVFITAGQSNAVGAGDSLYEPAPPDGTLKYEGGILQKMKKTVGHLDETGSLTTDMGDAWSSFAIKWKALTGHNIAFIPAAQGGSFMVDSVNNTTRGSWGGDGNLTDSLIDLAKAGLIALKNAGYSAKLKGVLWNQGEADAFKIYNGTLTDGDYITAFNEMTTKIRDSLDRDLPFYIFKSGMVNPDYNSTDYLSYIRPVQEQIAQDDSLTKIVFRGAINFVKDGLMNPDPTFAALHYSQAGYNIMGREGAEGVFNSNIPGTSSNALLMNTEAGTDNTEITYDSTNNALHIGPLPYFSVHKKNQLSVVGNRAVAVLEGYSNDVYPGLIFLHAGGSLLSPTAIDSGTILSQIASYGYNGTGFNSKASSLIKVSSTQDFIGTKQGSTMEFLVTPTDSISAWKMMRITSNGSVHFLYKGSNEKDTIADDAAKVVVNTSPFTDGGLLVNTESDQYGINIKNNSDSLLLIQSNDTSYVKSTGIIYLSGYRFNSYMLDGDGVTTDFNVIINPGFTPSKIIITPTSADAAAAQLYVDKSTITSTQFTVKVAGTTPPSGTDNITFDYELIK